MPQPIPTQLGTFTGTGSGTPRAGQVGDHTFSATLSGSGAVSATVLIEASNDNAGWSTIATLTLSGTATAAATATSTASYAYWRATVSAMMGASLVVAAATEQVTDASALTSLQKSRLLAVLPGAESLVSDARITTWSNRAALVTAGLTTAFFTDVGVGGSYWDYVGGKWRPQARQVTLRNLVSSLSHNSSAKIVVAEATLLAGLLQDGDILAVDYLKTKEGGTSDTEATDILLGATAGTLGTSLALSTSALATTTQQVSSRYLYRRESATTIRPISITGPQGIGSSTGAPAGVITVPNMDSQATYLQISGDMTTGGGAETVWLRGFVVTLISGA